MKRKLRQFADANTPTGVHIKDKWDILVWMFGQYGPWVLFGFSTWLLYQDNKEMQSQILAVTREQITVNAQVVTGLRNVETEFIATLKVMNLELEKIEQDAKEAHRAAAMPKK